MEEEKRRKKRHHFAPAADAGSTISAIFSRILYPRQLASRRKRKEKCSHSVVTFMDGKNFIVTGKLPLATANLTQLWREISPHFFLGESELSHQLFLPRATDSGTGCGQSVPVGDDEKVIFLLNKWD